MKSGSDVLSNVDYDSQKSCYERSKKRQHSPFCQRIRFEDLKHESEGEGAHHAKSYLTKDGQFSMIMKQISHLNTQIDQKGSMV